MNGSRLNKAVEYVRNTFFQRWDKIKQWKVKVIHNAPFIGKVNFPKKEIYIRNVSKSDEELHFLLIHEICHAVTGGSHGKKWFNRMLRASKIAKGLGRDKLSKMLENEIQTYKSRGLTISARLIYNEIQNAVFKEPGAPYKKIIKHVANSYGFYPQELEKKYKKSKEVYGQTVRVIKTLKKAREESKRGMEISLQEKPKGSGVFWISDNHKDEK